MADIKENTKQLEQKPIHNKQIAKPAIAPSLHKKTNIMLEETEKNLALAPVLLQFEENAKFSQAIIAIRKDKIVFYNDMISDAFLDNKKLYNAKISYDKKAIRCIIVEKIKNAKSLKDFGRLHIIANKEEDCRVVYFYKKDKKLIKVFLKNTKKQRIKIRKDDVDCSSIL